MFQLVERVQGLPGCQFIRLQLGQTFRGRVRRNIEQSDLGFFWRDRWRAVGGSVFQLQQAFFGFVDHAGWYAGQGGDLQTIALVGRTVFDRMQEDDTVPVFDGIEMNIDHVAVEFGRVVSSK